YSSLATYASQVTVPFTNLSDGTYTFTVRAVDAAGNAGTSSKTIYVDTDQPGISITGKPNNPSNNGSPSFQFQGTDLPPDALAPPEVLTYQCKLDTPSAPGTYQACDTSGVSYSNLTPDGVYSFSVKVTDAAGNTNNAS